MQRYLLLFGLFFALLSCTSEPAEDTAANTPSLQEQMIGTWEVTYLKVDLSTVNNIPDSFAVDEYKEAEWQQLFRVKPYRTYFAQDSTFRTVRRAINDQIISEDRGLWRAFGDTLMLLQPDATLQYKVAFNNGKAEWAGLIDWDGDGKEDDAIHAIYRYVGRTSNE